MVGNDAIYGDGQNDTIVGGYGNDWISGGTGDDGILGDDGRIFLSRVGTAEPLYGIAPSTAGDLNVEITTPGRPAGRAHQHGRTRCSGRPTSTPDNLDHSTSTPRARTSCSCR